MTLSSRRIANFTPSQVAPTEKQLEFSLQEFQEITGIANTNTMELMDALPLYQQQAYSAPTDAPRIETFAFRKRPITATVKPAAIVKNGKMHYTFAGMREQIVEAMLRKMISEPGSHVVFTQNAAGEQIPAIVTSPYLIRKRLSAIGHGFKLSEIRQALDILGNTKFTITYTDPKTGKPVDIEGENAIIGRSHRTPHDDATGERSIEKITLHPLVLKSILDRTYRQLDWAKYIGLKRPGAKWLYARIIHHFTGVESNAGPMSKPYNIDLETILSSSGMRRYKAQDGTFLVKDNVRQVRLDLDELTQAGILNLMRPYTERLRRGRDKGKRGPERIIGAVWELYVSPDTSKNIIETSERMLKSAPRLRQ